MPQCSICGVVIHSSDTPENVLRNHTMEAHPTVKPVPTYEEGYAAAVMVCRVIKGAEKLADEIAKEYKDPE